MKYTVLSINYVAHCVTHPWLTLAQTTHSKKFEGKNGVAFFCALANWLRKIIGSPLWTRIELCVRRQSPNSGRYCRRSALQTRVLVLPISFRNIGWIHLRIAQLSASGRELLWASTIDQRDPESAVAERTLIHSFSARWSRWRSYLRRTRKIDPTLSLIVVWKTAYAKLASSLVQRSCRVGNILDRFLEAGVSSD